MQEVLDQISSLNDLVGAMEALVAVVIVVGAKRQRHLVAKRGVLHVSNISRKSAVKPASFEIPQWGNDQVVSPLGGSAFI